IMSVSSFLLPELKRMCFDTAPGRTQRVLHLQHFVKQDIHHRIARNRRSVQPPIHDNLIECRIKTAELCSPYTPAPSEPRPRQPTAEIRTVEPRKHGSQIVHHT